MSAEYGYGSSADPAAQQPTTGSGAPLRTQGPHESRTANAVDPRVDSDRDTRAVGTSGAVGAGTTTGTGVSSARQQLGGAGAGAAAPTGYNDLAGTHGPHETRAANVADPRVDSDRDHRAAVPESTTAGQTAGSAPVASAGAATTAAGTGAATGTGQTATTAPTEQRRGGLKGMMTETQDRLTAAMDTFMGKPGTSNTSTTTGAQTDPSAAAPATGQMPAEGTSQAEAGHKHGGLKGRIAQAHGIGETARGRFNAGMDDLLGDPESKPKDLDVAAAGEREMAGRR